MYCTTWRGAREPRDCLGRACSWRLLTRSPWAGGDALLGGLAGTGDPWLSGGVPPIRLLEAGGARKPQEEEHAQGNEGQDADDDADDAAGAEAAAVVVVGLHLGRVEPRDLDVSMSSFANC